MNYKLDVECREQGRGVMCVGARRNIQGALFLKPNRSGICESRQNGNLSIVSDLIQHIKRKNIIDCKNL